MQITNVIYVTLNRTYTLILTYVWYKDVEFWTEKEIKTMKLNTYGFIRNHLKIKKIFHGHYIWTESSSIKYEILNEHSWLYRPAGFFFYKKEQYITETMQRKRIIQYFESTYELHRISIADMLPIQRRTLSNQSIRNCYNLE